MVMQNDLRIAVRDGILEASRIAPSLRIPNPRVIPFPTKYNRYPFTSGTNRIMLDQGQVRLGTGTLDTFQVPRGFVAHSFVIVADGDVEITIYGKGTQWGPFFVEQMTPASFSNLEVVQIDLKCNPGFDAQILFSEDVYPPLEIAAFGSYPCLRYGSITTGLAGTWNDILFGPGNMAVSQAVPLAGRFLAIEAMALGRKHVVFTNTTANVANVRIRGSIFSGGGWKLDPINGPAGSLVVPANDILDVQFVTPWKSLNMQAQTPVGGTATVLNVEFMGVANG